jgi:AmmeMemoRadiSam system protein B
MKKVAVRKASVAGFFYPSAKKELAAQISDFLQGTPRNSLRGDLAGVIVPHAGYEYSGRIAAEVYHLPSMQKIQSCIILGPNHQARGKAGTSIYAKGSFETPLGHMTIDEELADAILKRDDRAAFDIEAHEGEHSIEVQIPFLQAVNSSLKIVPIVMSDYRYETCAQLSLAIEGAAAEFPGKKILVVASTDFSHYHAHARAVQMDDLAMKVIEKLDAEGLFKKAEAGEVELCGLGPALVLMLILKRAGDVEARALQYANSGDVTGDKSSVVGYAAMVFFKKER